MCFVSKCMFSPLNFKLYQHIQERLYFQYAIVFKQLASYLFKCKEPKPSFGFFFFFFLIWGLFLCCAAGLGIELRVPCMLYV
ncbi:rCG36531, isoform CRA_a [Rattus norvegicus]|uniref:RCG36531, isoform CRA_a n=1 Tax=Rattus norvegicus TaxID=10116 RepID=A6JSS1_RAT|nr:rCG36531, isoform CRA_a [Rattus norvegicus]